MTATLLGHPDVAGSMTSGGTESILMAVKTAREWARATMPRRARARDDPARDRCIRRSRRRRTTSACASCTCRSIAHLRADVDAMKAAHRTTDTILLVGSAPSYPHGVVDPIDDIAALAGVGARPLVPRRRVRRRVHAPVRARSSGDAVPPFDFACPASRRCRRTCTSTARRPRARRSCSIARASCGAPVRRLHRLARRSLRLADRAGHAARRPDRGRVGRDEVPRRRRLPAHREEDARHERRAIIDGIREIPGLRSWASPR